MIDPTGEEKAAMRSALQPLSDYIEHEIGWETPLSDFDRCEILELIEVIVTSYHNALLATASKHWPLRMTELNQLTRHSDVGLY